MNKEAYILKNKIYWQGEEYSPAKFTLFVHHKLQEELDEWERQIYLFVRDWLDDSILSIQVTTSGSTGKAKIISINKEAMVKSAIATGEFLGLQEQNSALLCLPTQFIAGKMMLVRAFVLGLDLYYLPPKIDAILNVDSSFDFCAMIPLQVQFALDQNKGHLLEQISTLIIGGAPLSAKYKERIARFNNNVYATYGMTETVTHIALQKINGDDKSDFFTCLPGTRVELFDECLQIKSGIFRNKTIQTNDLALVFSPYTFKIIGRKDFVINSGALKINPIELEEELSSLLNQPFIISYRKDIKLGEKVVLLLEGEESSIDSNKLLNNIRKHIVSQKAPKEIIFIPELLRTANGKIDRKRNQEYIGAFKN